MKARRKTKRERWLNPSDRKELACHPKAAPVQSQRISSSVAMTQPIEPMCFRAPPSVHKQIGTVFEKQSDKDIVDSCWRMCRISCCSHGGSLEQYCWKDVAVGVDGPGGIATGVRDFSIFTRGPWGMISTGIAVEGSSVTCWIGPGKFITSKEMKCVMRRFKGCTTENDGCNVGLTGGIKSRFDSGSRNADQRASWKGRDWGSQAPRGWARLPGCEAKIRPSGWWQKI
jgi:hypothetical protein